MLKKLMQPPSNKASMIRVDHAGEYGATQIYKGQLFILGTDKSIEHMAEQEKEHLKAFTHLIVSEKVRPSILQPLWHVGGFMMGALTAAMGRNVAHACTAAVETVIDEHYQEQLIALQENNALDDQEKDKNQKLMQLIEHCRAEECEHKKIAEDESGVDLETSYPITTNIIKGITRAAIEIAKRI